MSMEHIVHSAVDKALRNGWSGGEASKTAIDYYVQKHHTVLMSPEFAKAYWGESHEPGIDDACVRCGQSLDPESFWSTLPCWQYALQQMALEKDPVSYLARRISR